MIDRPAVVLSVVVALLLGLSPPPAASEAGAEALGNWGQWRGPLATGEAPRGDPPVEWSESRNIRWKVEIPGRGHASPVVWGKRVFVLTAVESAAPAAVDASVPTYRQRRRASGPLRFLVLALDRATGKILWQRTAREEQPHESATHPDATWASASPITDGEMVFAHFGSRGLYAYDLDGEPLWTVDLGDMSTRREFGEGSSAALAGETLVVNWDHEGESFVVALDRRSGKERWRRQRDEVTSWSTPLIVDAGGRSQVVISATGKVRGYDLDSGEPLWESGGMTVNVIPTPVEANGLVYAASGFRGSSLRAIRLTSGPGAEAGSVVWAYDRDTPYVPSPLLYGGHLYFLKVNSGILTALDATTGTAVFGPERLPGVDGVYASPVAAAGRVYIVGRDGTTLVLRHGDRLEVLAENRLDDGFDASPAIVGRELFLRGRKSLYSITESGE